jgi:hypothetical protein
MTARPIPPPLVYHGTGAAFDAFAPNDRGIYFAERYDTAASYQRIRKTDTPRVLASSVDITRPWQMIRYPLDTPYSKMVDQSVATLSARGYDGIYMPQERAWVAFRPEQVTILEQDVPAACFAPYLRAAVEQTCAGNYFEESGCWGMALALRSALGHGSEIVLSDDNAYPCARTGGRCYDWRGESPFAGGRVVTRDELLNVAFANECPENQVVADCEWAAQIIEVARFSWLIRDGLGDIEQSIQHEGAPRG